MFATKFPINIMGTGTSSLKSPTDLLQHDLIPFAFVAFALHLVRQYFFCFHFIGKGGSGTLKGLIAWLASHALSVPLVFTPDASEPESGEG